MSLPKFVEVPLADWKKVNADVADLRKQLQAAEDILIAGPDKVLRCAFCGEPYPDGTPTHKSAILAAHIRECKVHPVGIENRALRLKIASAWLAVGYINSILEEKDGAGIDIEIGSTALKSLIRWSREAKSELTP